MVESDDSSKRGLVRFSIGVYQIHQALDWQEKHPLSFAEACCACVLNVIGAAESVGVKMEDYLADGYSDWPYQEADPKFLLDRVSRLCQMYFYYHVSLPGTVRKARVDLSLVGIYTAELVERVLRMVPVRDRVGGFELAMSIMQGLEWRR